MFGDKLKYPLPQDIDLTEDDVFRHRIPFITINKVFEGTLPWEELDNIDSWISRYIISDASMTSTIRISQIGFNINDWSVESDNSSTLGFNNIATTAREIMFTQSNDYATTYTIDDGLVSFYPINYVRFKKDAGETEEFKQFTELYKDLPFSPVFKGVKENHRDYNTNKQETFISEYAYKSTHVNNVKSLSVDGLKHNGFGDASYRRSLSSIYRRGTFDWDGIVICDEHGEYRYEISSFDSHDDGPKYLDSERLPWEQERGWFMRE